MNWVFSFLPSLPCGSKHFEFDFSMIFLSEHPLDTILAAIKNVSEIADAIGGKINLDDVMVELEEDIHDETEE